MFYQDSCFSIQEGLTTVKMREAFRVGDVDNARQVQNNC